MSSSENMNSVAESSVSTKMTTFQELRKMMDYASPPIIVNPNNPIGFITKTDGIIITSTHFFTYEMGNIAYVIMPYIVKMGLINLLLDIVEAAFFYLTKHNFHPDIFLQWRTGKHALKKAGRYLHIWLINNKVIGDNENGAVAAIDGTVAPKVKVDRVGGTNGGDQKDGFYVSGACSGDRAFKRSQMLHCLLGAEMDELPVVVDQEYREYMELLLYKIQNIVNNVGMDINHDNHDSDSDDSFANERAYFRGSE